MIHALNQNFSDIKSKHNSNGVFPMQIKHCSLFIARNPLVDEVQDKMLCICTKMCRIVRLALFIMKGYFTFPHYMKQICSKYCTRMKL